MHLIDEKSYDACGFTPQSRILAAFSGGADSTALLLELLRLCREGALSAVAAAHMHHGLRGESADADAEFCKEFCRAQDIPFFITHADAADFAREEGLSVEHAARELRYRFLAYVANENGYDKIAVAHHMTDQAETLLQHLIRGSGLRGLCGMRPLTGDVARPLLHCAKADILDFLAKAGQAYCEDATNSEPIAQRNRLRSAVLPLLLAENPKAVENIARCAAHLQGDSDILELISATALVASAGKRENLAMVPTPLRRRALMFLLAQEGVTQINANALEKMENLLVAQSGSYSAFSDGVFAIAEGERVVFDKKAPIIPAGYHIPVAAGETVITPQGRVKLARVKKASLPPPKGSLYLHAKAVQGEFYIRLPNKGDKFRPFGMEGRKLLSDYFTDKKVYRTRRAVPLLCDEAGIAAICGFTIDERFRVADADTDILILTYEPLSNGGGTNG